MNPTSFIPHLYQDLPPLGNKISGKNEDYHETGSGHSGLEMNVSSIPTFASKLGLPLPNPAPEVSPQPEQMHSALITTTGPFSKYQDITNDVMKKNMKFIVKIHCRQNARE